MSFGLEAPDAGFIRGIRTQHLDSHLLVRLLARGEPDLAEAPLAKTLSQRERADLIAFDPRRVRWRGWRSTLMGARLGRWKGRVWRCTVILERVLDIAGICIAKAIKNTLNRVTRQPLESDDDPG